jgi:hypothetical protein
MSDMRNKAWCYHCGDGIGRNRINREHIPTKNLLEKPYPANLPVAHVCEECNESYSLDEEYFAAFISSVLTGSTKPSEQKKQSGRRVLTGNEPLRERIERGKKSFVTIGGETQTLWDPEWPRISRVIEKNARGHVFFENGEPIFDREPIVTAFPLELASQELIDDFFGVGTEFRIWPEVGSRWMQRLILDQDFDEFGFLVVQEGNYRFKLEFEDGLRVKSIISEYLATVVTWNDL